MPGPEPSTAPLGLAFGERARLAVRRAWALPLGAHLVALAVLLCVVAPLLRPGDTFTADEGTYAIQARALDRGSWEYDDRTEGYGPEEAWFALRNAHREGDRWFAYVHHPAYPLVLLAATRVVGESVGLYVWGLIGVLGVAATAWLVAVEADRLAGRGAFWLAAAAPVGVNGQLVLAHAPSAALAGVAVLSALRARRSASVGWKAVLLLTVAAGALLRSEAVLFGGALAVALALVPAARRSPTARLGLPVAVAATAVATALAEKLWIRSIVGGSVPEGGVRGENVATTVGSGGGLAEFLRGRVEGAWHSLLQGSHSGEVESLIVAVALAMVGFASWAAARRRPGWRRDIQVGLGVAALLYVARLIIGVDQSITGLVAAWPVVAFGAAIALPFGVAGRAALPAVAIALFSVGVVATQYRFGGGFEWGGRFFSPATVPLAVVACLGLRALLAAMPERQRAMRALVVVLAVVPLATGFAVVRYVRPLLGDVVDDVEARGARVVITHSPALPPSAWRTYPHVSWMVVARSDLIEAVSRVRRTSGVRLDLVVDRTWSRDLKAAFPGLRDVTGPGEARLGWRALTVPPALDP